MSKERELLERVLAYVVAKELVVDDFEMTTQIDETFIEIKDYLAQPEQKREPLSDDEIFDAWIPSKVSPCGQSFNAGVKFAEKAHGIGVDDV